MISILGADGRSYGPVDAEQVRRWISEGRASLETLAQREGEQEWRPLADFPEVVPPIPRTLPPPLPGAGAPASGLAGDETSRLPLASPWARLVAALIDTSLSLFFALPGMLMLTLGVLRAGTPLEELLATGFAGHEAATSTMMLCMMLPALAQIWLLTTRGQTIGKWLLQLRIVRAEDDSRVGFLRAVLLRSLVPGLIGTLPIVGSAFALLDLLFIFRRDRRCLHDHIAGTQVVRCD